MQARAARRRSQLETVPLKAMRSALPAALAGTALVACAAQATTGGAASSTRRAEDGEIIELVGASEDPQTIRLAGSFTGSDHYNKWTVENARKPRADHAYRVTLTRTAGTAPIALYASRSEGLVRVLSLPSGEAPGTAAKTEEVVLIDSGVEALAVASAQLDLTSPECRSDEAGTDTDTDIDVVEACLGQGEPLNGVDYTLEMRPLKVERVSFDDLSNYNAYGGGRGNLDTEEEWRSVVNAPSDEKPTGELDTYSLLAFEMHEPSFISHLALSFTGETTPTLSEVSRLRANREGGSGHVDSFLDYSASGPWSGGPLYQKEGKHRGDLSPYGHQGSPESFLALSHAAKAQGLGPVSAKEVIVRLGAEALVSRLEIYRFGPDEVAPSAVATWLWNDEGVALRTAGPPSATQAGANPE